MAISGRTESVMLRSMCAVKLVDRKNNEELMKMLGLEEILDKMAAWRSGSERRFYDDHDRKVDGLPPNLVSLLRPWIRCFTMIISAWWNLASSKLKKSDENSSGKLGNKGNS